MVVGVRAAQQDPPADPPRRHVGGQRLPEPAHPPGASDAHEHGIDGGAGVADRRIRDDVRDGAYVMAFTALASTATAVALVALSRLAG